LCGWKLNRSIHVIAPRVYNYASSKLELLLRPFSVYINEHSSNWLQLD